MLWFFFLPILFRVQGAGALQIGLIYSVTTLSSAFLQMPFGSFVDRYGRKTSILLGGFVQFCSVLLLAVIPGPLAAALAYILFSGVGGVLSELGRTALIVESVPTQPLAVSFGSWKTMAGSIAVAAPLLGGFMIQTYGMREVLLVSSGLLLAVVLSRGAFLRETFKRTFDTHKMAISTSSPFKGLAEFHALLHERPILLFAVAYGIYNALLLQSSFVVPLYCQSVLGLSPVQIGLMFSVFVVFDAVFALPYGKLADHFGHGRTILISWVAEMSWMMIFAYSASPMMALLAFSFWVAFGSLDGPALQAVLGTLTGTERRGFSLGFFNTFALAIVIPAELVTGALYSVSSRLPFFADLLVDLIALGFFLLFLRSRRFEGAE
jgi:DHA1 family multidrug resistance protein-like MFS transporter